MCPCALKFGMSLTEEKPKDAHKLLIDRESDFKFHCAYLAYSQAWEENDNAQAREKLNNLIESLSNNRTDYYAFYQELNSFRSNVGYRSYNRIQTSRKSEWRHKEAGRSRNRRHRK